MNSHEVFIHIYQGCLAGTGAIVRLPQCQWSKPDGYGKINQCITTTKHSKAVTVCIFLGIYCISAWQTTKYCSVHRYESVTRDDVNGRKRMESGCVNTWWRARIIQPSVNNHYGDVIMGAIASQITSLTIVYSTVYSDADQRKHQSSASLAFVWGIHRGPVNSPHKWPVTRKMFPFDDVIMSMFLAHYSHRLAQWTRRDTSGPFPQITHRVRKGSSHCFSHTIQGLYSLNRHRLTCIGIPIVNWRWSDDRLRFIIGIHITIIRCLLMEWVHCFAIDNEVSLEITGKVDR